MDKKTIKTLEEKLKAQKEEIEKKLSSFAKKDEKLEGDWDTKFPKWNAGSGSGALEIAADQVEEYSKLLSLEHKLELRLRDTNDALKKIKNNAYGNCEKCGKKIPEERLKACPEAKSCLKC
jgi:RNA polymerase-binding transcription factor DksA